MQSELQISEGRFPEPPLRSRDYMTAVLSVFRDFHMSITYQILPLIFATFSAGYGNIMGANHAGKADGLNTEYYKPYSLH